MITISHRGNISGPSPSLENNPKHIQTLVDQNINVEIDVWWYKNTFFLGHDTPIYEITQDFLIQPNLWCHAKNLEALTTLLNMNTICFWHQEDDHTLTSNNFIWTYPNKETNTNSIIVDITADWKNKNYKCAGVCVDYF